MELKAHPDTLPLVPGRKLAQQKSRGLEQVERPDQSRKGT